MEDHVIMGISLVITGIITYFAYGRLKNKKTKNQQFIDRAARGGYCTVGVYDSSKVIRGIRESSNSVYRDDSLKVKYRYEVNGITYYKHLTFMNNGRISARFPSEVKVYYDPRNPKNAVCPEEATKAMQVRSGCMTTMAVFIITLTVVFNVLRFLLG